MPGPKGKGIADDSSEYEDVLSSPPPLKKKIEQGEKRLTLAKPDVGKRLAQQCHFERTEQADAEGWRGTVHSHR